MGGLLIVLLSAISTFLHWVNCPNLRVWQLSASQEIQFGGADPARFIKQGQWLFERRGYMYPENVSCTALPPGYPLFLSTMMFFTDRLFVLQLLQVGCRTAAVLAMWLRLRRIKPRFAMVAAVLMATSPILARQASTLMSECFGFCLLVCLSISLLNLLQYGCGGSIHSFAIGTLLAAICFTSPFMLFPAVFAFLACFVEFSRSSWRHLIALVFGAGFPYAIWQVHCLAVAGHTIPEIYRGGASFDQVWIRSWARSPDEFTDGLRVFVWRTPDPDWSRVPQHAWSDGRMREEIMDAVKKYADSGSQKESTEAKRLDQLLADAGRRGRKQSLLSYYVGLPVLRATRSWSDVPETWYNYFLDVRVVDRLSFFIFIDEIGELGVVKAALRQARSLASGLVWCYTAWGVPWFLHLLWTGFCLVCVVLTLRSRCPTGVVVLGGLVVFLLFHAFFSPESRRIAPVYPLVVFVGAAGLLEPQKRSLESL